MVPLIPCGWMNCTQPATTWAAFGAQPDIIDHGAYCDQHTEELRSAHQTGNLAVQRNGEYTRTSDLLTQAIP